MKLRAKVALFVLLPAASCSHTSGADQELDATARLAAIAADYESWAPVDEVVRRAPTDCRRPPAVGPHSSAASGNDAHAEKLYHLFARDRAAYLGLESGAPQHSQVVVKQSFVAEPWTMTGPGQVPEGVVQLRDGSYARCGAAAGLFVMMNDGSGRGKASWTYGTVAPDGAVTSVGQIGTCIACHNAAPFDGLFGVE